MHLTFVGFLFLFVVIGISSLRVRKKTTVDYLLAHHNISPWLAGLSAVATNNSGYMFIGLIGYTYTAGLQSIWLMIGWIAGDFIASLSIHRQLRDISEKRSAHTYAGALGRWQGGDFPLYRLIAGVISLIFLGSYAAAQFNAGSKALHVILGWDAASGAIIGAIIVVLYCFAGGIRASIWTDAAQSIVMIIAMAILLWVGLDQAGGYETAKQKWNGIDGFMDWFPGGLAGGSFFGPVLFIIGWFFAGFGVAGQPHIMIRFMAIDNAQNMGRAKVYYYTWFTLFYGAATGVGLLARILLPETGSFDAELALPKLALLTLPAPLVGLILAGIFAATISTADSLILSCSASVSNDIFQKQKFSYGKTKASTILVAAIALLVALYGEQSVFKLVIVSWAALAAAFLPLLVLYLLNEKVGERSAIALLGVSLAILFIWRSSGLSEHIYEIFPSVTGALVVFYAVIRPLQNAKSGSEKRTMQG